MTGSDTTGTSKPPSSDITALILCGGGGQRLGGVDKPLASWHGKPLIEHALGGLPANMPVVISANRNLERYQSYGWPVVRDDSTPPASDTQAGLGPLAGIAAARAHLHTPWLYVVPGDAPRLPTDLPASLKSLCVRAHAIACCVCLERRQPLPLLVSAAALPELQTYLRHGARSVGGWLNELNAAELPRTDASAFANFNTPEDFNRDADAP